MECIEYWKSLWENFAWHNRGCGNTLISYRKHICRYRYKFIKLADLFHTVNPPPPPKKKTNNSIANFTLRLHNQQNCRTKTKYLSFWKGQTSTDMMNEFCATFFFLSDLRQDLEVFGKLFEHFFITKHRRKKTFRDHKRI